MRQHKAATLSQQIAVHSVSPGCFASICHPARLGSLTSTSFGGSSLAIAISAAFQESRRNFHLYSISGYFIRPAKTDRKLFGHVENEYEDGTSKICLVALADFHVMEPRSMVAFSTAPELTILPVTSNKQSLDNPSQLSCSDNDLYHDIERFVEMQPLSLNTAPVDSRIHDQERFATFSAKSIHTERLRARGHLQNEAEQISALSFYMDKGLAYIPALNNGYHPSEASACASLDFSLRFFEHHFNLE
ncbi:unnamed protein product [Penicillium pancosmium]